MAKSLMIKRTLSAPETRQLADANKFIHKWKDQFCEVGNRLDLVNREKLFRDDYDTFADYCKGEFGFTRQWAHRTITSSKVAAEVKDATGDDVKKKAAEALGKIDKDRVGTYKAAKAIASDRGAADVGARDILSATTAGEESEAPPPPSPAAATPVYRGRAIWNRRFETGVVGSGMDILRERVDDLGLDMHHPLVVKVKEGIDATFDAFNELNNIRRT